MRKISGIILREFVGIRGGPTEEHSYETNLRECLAAKQRAQAETDIVGAGHAARGAAECFRRLGRLDEAGSEYRTAVNLLKIAEDRRGLAWTFHGYGSLLRQSSRFTETFDVLSEAMTLTRILGDPGLIAYVSAGIAETSRIVGDYRTAHRQHLVAYRIFRSLEDSRGVVWSLEGIGQMLKNTGRIHEAQEHFAEAKKLATEANDIRGLAYALKCHAECLSSLGHPLAATEEALHSVELFKHIGLKIGLSYALKSLGDIFQARRKHIEALKNYRDAAQLFSQSNDARGLAYTFTGLGALFSNVGAIEIAGACLAHAANYFSSTRLSFGCRQSKSALDQLAQQHGLSMGQMRNTFQAAQCGVLPLPDALIEPSAALLPERRELVQAGWRLLNQYRRRGVRYLLAEKAKVWEGTNQADCSSFVQHALIQAGYGYARVGRLTAGRLQQGSFWSKCFQEVPRNASKPGDIILQGSRHMGIFTGIRDGQPTGFQMGVKSNASELVWGENSDTASVGQDIRFFRLKPRFAPT